MQRVENLHKDITYLSLEEFTKNISICYILIAQIISGYLCKELLKKMLTKKIEKSIITNMNIYYG
jgi:hypothetical protein